MRTGTGKAFLILKKFKKRRLPFSLKREILHACRHNLGYDQQSESDDRPEYMFEIIRLTNEERFFANKIAETFQKSYYVNDWDKGLAFKLLCNLRKDSFEELSTVLRKIFRRSMHNSHSHILGLDLIEAEGLEGLKFIFDSVGRYITKGKQYWIDTSLLSYSRKKHGVEIVENFLKMESRTNSYIARYIEEDEAERNRLNEILRNKSKKKYKRYVRKYNIGYEFRKRALDDLSFSEDFDKIFDAIDNLVYNFEPSDCIVIERLLNRMQRFDNEEFHCIASRILDLFDKNRTPDSFKLLLAIYKRMNCGPCRKQLVKILIGNSMAPKWLLKETIYDSNPETRELVKNYLSKRV